MSSKPKHPGGRPPIEYTKELGEEICLVISTSPYGLNRICADNPSFPKKTTIYEWKLKYKEFAEMYLDAKLKQADILAEHCLDIADDAKLDVTLNNKGEPICDIEFVQRAKLRIDTRKWLAAKLLPRIYGLKNAENVENMSEEELQADKARRDKYIGKNEKDY